MGSGPTVRCSEGSPLAGGSSLHGEASLALQEEAESLRVCPPAGGDVPQDPDPRKTAASALPSHPLLRVGPTLSAFP